MLSLGDPAIYSVRKCVKVAYVFRQIIATFFHATSIPYFVPIMEMSLFKFIEGNDYVNELIFNCLLILIVAKHLRNLPNFSSNIGCITSSCFLL